MAVQSKEAVVTASGEREIRTERVFDAPRELVWRAFSEPELLARWFGRGNRVEVERFEFEPGGRWRMVERAPEGTSGFEGRFREIRPPELIEQTFEWDGAPGHVSVETATFEDLGDGRTRIATVSLLLTQEDRDAMLGSGMEQGMNESYAALDRLLDTIA